MTDMFRLYSRRNGGQWEREGSYYNPEDANARLAVLVSAGSTREFVVCVNDELPNSVAADLADEGEVSGKFRVDNHFEGEGWQFGMEEFDSLDEAIAHADAEFLNGVTDRPSRVVDSLSGEVFHVRDDKNYLSDEEFEEVSHVAAEPFEIEDDDPFELDLIEEEPVHIPTDVDMDEFAYGIGERLMVLTKGRKGVVEKVENNGYGNYYTVKMDDDVLREVVAEADLCLLEDLDYSADYTFTGERKGLFRRIAGGTVALAANSTKAIGRGVWAGTKGTLSAAGSGLKLGGRLTKAGVKLAATGVVAAALLTGGAYASGEVVKVLADYDDNPVVETVINLSEEASAWLDS